MKIVQVTDELKSDYDEFVKTFSNGSFRQGFAWGEVMSYDNDIIRLGLMSNGSFVGAISIQVKRFPGTPFTVLYAPRGPIFSFEDSSAATVLLDAVRETAHQHKAIFLRIDPDFGHEHPSIRQTLQEQGFRYLERKNWSYFNYPRILMRLDLADPEEVLWERLRKKHRQHVNTLSKKGIVIEEPEGATGVGIFYELMTELSIRKKFPVRSRSYYDRLVAVYGEDIRILLARSGEQVLGGVMSLIYGNKCWYMHGATVDGKGNLHPAEGLHWEMIKWAKSRGCTFYDLGGTGTDYPVREDNPNYSLYHFKKGFGAEIHYLTGYYDLIFSPVLYRMFRVMEEQGLPFAVKFFSYLRSTYSNHE